MADLGQQKHAAQLTMGGLPAAGEVHAPTRTRGHSYGIRRVTGRNAALPPAREDSPGFWPSGGRSRTKVRPLFESNANDEPMHSVEGMSAYEARAWSALIHTERQRKNGIAQKAKDGAAGAARRVGAALERVPGSAQAGKTAQQLTEPVQKLVLGSLKALFDQVFLRSVHSVSLDRRLQRLQKKHPEVGSPEVLRMQDLEILDTTRPRFRHQSIAGIEGALSSLAITGLQVSTTVTGGTSVGAIAAVIAADSAASLALLGRSVAEVAVNYGYDPRLPDEEMYLMGIMSYSTASAGSAAKIASFKELTNLTGQMMRGATWKQLGQDQMVRALQTVFAKLGWRLTHKRLAQAVPIAGAVLLAGLSVQMMETAIRDATRIYRLRFLTEKYGLDASEWLVEIDSEELQELAHGDDDVISLDIDDYVDEADNVVGEADEAAAGDPKQ